MDKTCWMQLVFDENFSKVNFRQEFKCMTEIVVINRG